MEVGLRERVLAAVRARRAVDERERRSLAEVVDAFGRLTDPFDRHADPVHVTGSGLIVGRRGIVLLRHRRLGIWVQPGGHLDAGETPWAAARRESAEETGLTVELADVRADGVPPLAHVDVHPGGRGHTHLDLRYLLHAAGDSDPRPPAGESQEVGWFAWPAAIERADPAMVGVLAALVAAQQTNLRS